MDDATQREVEEAIQSIEDEEENEPNEIIVADDRLVEDE